MAKRVQFRTSVDSFCWMTKRSGEPPKVAAALALTLCARSKPRCELCVIIFMEKLSDREPIATAPAEADLELKHLR
jgi:hypothetical protein